MCSIRFPGQTTYQSLLKSFIAFFKCGHYVKPLNQEWEYFQSSKFTDNYNLIIPFIKRLEVSKLKISLAQALGLKLQNSLIKENI